MTSAARVAITYPVDALVSYHYYREDAAMEALVATKRLRIIGDSGAFSALTQGATIDLGAYAAWVERWREHLCWSASLDVIGNAEASYRNWTRLREQYGVTAVPTVHAGCDPSWLDAYGSEGASLLGLGGLVGNGPRAFRWAVHMFRYARDHWPDMRFHLWGMAGRQYLDNLPAWSADSSSTLAAPYMFAQLRLFDPASGRHHNVSLRGGPEIYRHAGLLRRVYGVEPAIIERSHPGNRFTLIRLSVAATQQYALWLQRRHRVTSPALLCGVERGPRLHFVSAGGGQQVEGVGRVDDLVSAAMPPPVGPLVHVVVGGGPSLGSNTNLTNIFSDAHQREVRQ